MIPEQAAKHEVQTHPFAQMVMEHWRDARPKMCRELEAMGKLYQAVWAAAVNTLETMQTLTTRPNNLPQDRAEELVYPMWYRIPPEPEPLRFDPTQPQLLISPETSD